MENKLEKAAPGTYQGVVPVDFAGRAVNLEKLKAIADKYNLWIIEDACHAPGGYFTDSKGQQQNCGNGEFADLAIFSFHPVKHIACGEGGMITTNNKELYEKLKLEQPLLAPSNVWRAYQQLDVTLSASKGAKNELIAMVSLIRKVCGIDNTLQPYDKTVDKNFQAWVFKKQAGTTTKFTEEQMVWLRMIKDYVAASFHLEKDDFELDPFNKNGGLGRMWQLFGERTEEIINELNEVLAA